MIIISKISDPIEKMDLYFGVKAEDLDRPFVLGAQSNDRSLPAIAQWGAASTFGLSNLDSLDGSGWKDWRDSLSKLKCSWVIPIIEKAEMNQAIKTAINEILEKYEVQSNSS